MEILKACGIGFFSVYLLLFFRLLLKTRQPIKYFLINALLSLWLFAVIELTCFATGFHIPFNWSTLATMSGLGIPGVIFILLLRIFIF